MFYETTIHDSYRYREAVYPRPSAGGRGLVATLVVAVVLALAFPAFASADSVAFVRGGDVHLATGDFTREYRVTYTGGYSDVTQADDGTMVALTGVRLHRLDRAGNVLADFDTPVSDTRPAPSKTFYGPYDPAISPDGTKLAYTYYYMTQSQNPSCSPADLRHHDQRGRHRLLARRPADRVGRAGAREALRLAPPDVDRQRQRPDLATRRTRSTTTC